MRGDLARFTPQLAAGVREERLMRWRKALGAA
jgi:glycerol kinase